MEWITSTLLDIAVIQSGSGFPKKYQGISGEKYPFYKVSDMNLIGNEESLHFENNTISAKTRDILKPSLFSIGSIVFPKVGAAIATNKKRILTKVGCVDNNVMGVIPKEDKVYPRFLFYWFQQQNLSEFANEAALPSIKKTTVEAWPISYPDSIKEQKRIVSLLDTVFADLEQTRVKTEQNLKNARELFESKKLCLFERLSNSSNLRPLPLVCENIFAGGDAPKKGLYSKEKTEKFDIPIYANAVKDNGLYGFTNYSRASEPSITIAARGSGTGHIKLRKEPFLPIVRLIVLTPNKEIIILEYLKHALQTLDILRSGSAIPQLTVPMIKKYSIPVPDLNVQRSTVIELENLAVYIERIETIYQKKLNAIDELKKSILQKAFRGELTNTAE